MLRRIWIMAMLVIGSVPAFAQAEWDLRADKEGVKVYTGDMFGSKIKAIKVVSEFEATPAQLAAVVMDVNTATDWVYHLKSSTMIKRVSANDLYYYAEVSLPWPATNRDFVAHLTLRQDPATKALVIDGPAVAGYIPAKKGIVRIDNSVGKWVITPIGANEVRVEYTMHVDPGGSLPSWLINMFATDAPLQIFKSLRGQLQRPVYKNTNLLSSN